MVNQKILYYSLGVLFKVDTLLKKNIRRSLMSLRLLLTYLLKNTPAVNNTYLGYIVFNSFIERKYLINYLNIFMLYKFSILGLAFFNYNSFFKKIKRNIKRRITKRLVKNI